MRVTREQEAQIIAALQAAPLDRIRLMKTIFLAWHRGGRREGPFHFQPYMYGPCAFDLYDALADMEQRGLVVQAPHPVNRWGDYYLTEAGKQAATAIPSDVSLAMEPIARWASTQGFRPLLDAVYREAPEFASKSILRAQEAAR